MIMKPQGWDEAVANDGTFKRLTAGGHVCVIKQARLTKSKSKGEDMLEMAFDILGGEFDKYFEEQYKFNQKNYPDSAKWSNAGIYRQVLVGKSMSMAKGMLLNIEKSNAGWSWNWDETELVGKKFGGVFREEEYLNNKNEKKTRVVCIAVRPVDGIEDIEVPEPKRLAETNGGGNFGGSYGFGGGLSDEDVPF